MAREQARRPRRRMARGYSAAARRRRHAIARATHDTGGFECPAASSATGSSARKTRSSSPPAACTSTTSTTSPSSPAPPTSPTSARRSPTARSPRSTPTRPAGCRASSASSRRPTSGSSRCPRRSTRRSPGPLLASDRVRYVGEPIAAVVAETREQAADAAEAVLVDYEPLDVYIDPGRRPGRPDAPLRGRRQQRRVRLDRPRHARPHRRRVLRRLRGRRCRGRSSTSASRRARSRCAGRRSAWVDGRLHQWVSTQHAQGIKEPIVAGNGVDADAGPRHHARRRRRLRRQDRHLPRGDPARPARQAPSAGRCAGRRPAASR